MRATELYVLMQSLMTCGSYQSSEPPGQNQSYACSLAGGLKRHSYGKGHV